ncbi:hypothetical protein DXZ75_02355 [Streptomyces sp. AcE210]|nr:hypothetical protein DXZ75_02355 [Streptomyces sp. AcE210]
MTSVGLLERREAAARVRVNELRVEAERVLAELGEAEAVLERDDRPHGAGRGPGCSGRRRMRLSPARARRRWTSSRLRGRSCRSTARG